MPKKKKNEITIRSSAAEYLTYVASVGGEESSVEMRYEDENIWLTQKMMATLYDVSVPAINQHNYPAETGTRILSYPCDWCIGHYGNRLAPYKEEANCTFVGRAYRIISCCLYCQPLHSIRY